MPYPVTTSSQIVSSDYNLIKGRVDSIMGTGSTGYGRTWTRVLPATTGSNIELWNSLLLDLHEIALHQNGVASTWSSQPLYNLGLPGQVIYAGFHNYIDTLTTTVEANRYTVASSQLQPIVVTQSSNEGVFSGQSIRSSVWTGQEITHQVKVSWYNQAQAQYWFNLGGRVEIKPSYQTPVGSDPDDLGWATFIDSISTQTYVRSDYVGSQTKFYPVLQNGSGYTFAVKATRDTSGASVLFDLSYNFSGTGGASTTTSLVVVPNAYTFSINDSAGTPFTLASSIVGAGTYSDQSNSSNRIAVNFESNGSFNVQGTTGGQIYVGNWGSPTTSAAGNNYWIRFTLNSLSGQNDYLATQTTGWLNLNLTRTVGILTTVLAGQGNSTASANYTVQIASDSGGSTIVASGNFILNSVAAQSSIGMNSVLPQNNTTYVHTGSGDVRIVFSFLSDGTVEVLGRAITSTQVIDTPINTFNWFTPPTVGVGNNYYIKIVKVGDTSSGPGSGGSTDISTYQLLNASRSVTVNAISTNAADQTQDTVYQVKISTSASDSNVVSSGLYTLNVTSLAIGDYIPGGGANRTPIDQRDER